LPSVRELKVLEPKFTEALEALVTSVMVVW